MSDRILVGWVLGGSGGVLIADRLAGAHPRLACLVVIACSVLGAVIAWRRDRA